MGTSFQVINENTEQGFVFLNAVGVFYTWALCAGVGGGREVWERGEEVGRECERGSV